MLKSDNYTVMQKLNIDYTGRVVVITGAAGGIGGAMCELFAENGAAVAVCDINLDGCEKAAAALVSRGYIAAPFRLDVTDRASLPIVAAEITAKLGRISVLVNNAGVNVGPNDRHPIDGFADDKWDWITSVDLDGTFNVSKAFIPFMKGNIGAGIINISSVVGLVPFRNQCAFAAAKAGVANLTKAMAIELASDGIRVNCIAPGSILMEGTKALFYADPEKAEKMMVNIPQHRPGSPADIANAAAFIASDCAMYMTGSVVTVDGGWTCGFARDF